MYSYAHVCMCSYTWRPVIYIRCLSPWLSILLFETRSPTEPGVNSMTSLTKLQVSVCICPTNHRHTGSHTVLSGTLPAEPCPASLWKGLHIQQVLNMLMMRRHCLPVFRTPFHSQILTLQPLNTGSLPPPPGPRVRRARQHWFPCNPPILWGSVLKTHPCCVLC